MTNKSINLSVVIATYNEEKNIAACLESVKNIADEIIIIDGQSTDETPEIAQNLGAKVISVPNKPNDFHANKQLGIDKATGEWILQLDADERVSTELESEIKIITKQNSSLLDEKETSENKPSHLQATSYKQQAINGFAIPRKNWFLGRFLTKGGVYPDYVVRLFRKGKGSFPKSKIINNSITTSNVHAQIEIKGILGHLKNDLIHYGDMEIERYLSRFNRYTSLESDNLISLNFRLNIIQALNYLIIKPAYWFVMRYFRHRGYVDGFQGFLFALFSSLHYPVIYLKIWEKSKSNNNDK